MSPEQLAAFQVLQAQVAQLQNILYQHKHTGADYTQLIDSSGTGGNMKQSTYDPAGIAQQVVGITATQTLTNKTLTNPIIAEISSAASTPIEFNAGTYTPIQTYTPSAAGTATLDLSKGNLHFITMPAGNITIALSNATIGQSFEIRILQDGTGSRTVTWFTTIKWAGGLAPTLTTTASKADSFGFQVTASVTYDACVIGQNI